MVRGRWIFLALLLVLLCALHLSAQEERWQQLNDQVKALYQQGQYADAVPVAQEALRVAEAIFRPDDLKVATAMNNLALLYKSEGKFAEAEPLYQRALQIREKALGPEHLDVAVSLSNLGLLYYSEGKYREAEPLYQRALQIREKVLGPEHLDVADSLNNLAVLYDSEGKYAEAEPIYQRALQIWEALGPEHLNFAQSLNNLGFMYYGERKYTEAEPLYQRALQIREKTLGPEHLDVAVSLNNLGLLYYSEDKYAKAEPLYQRALQIREKALGPEHLDVAVSLNNLGLLYYSEGKYAEAEPLDKRALQIREKALGPNHLDVAQSLSNLGLLYKKEGKHAEAEPLYQRALQIREKVLGPEHLDVAESLNNLAQLYLEDGKYAQAESLDQRGLQIREKAFGPDDPKVTATLNHLAGLYMEEGKYAQAEPLLQRSRQIREKVFGPDDPKVADTLNNLAGLYAEEGKYTQAEPLYQRALQIDEKALGPEHPNVAESLGNLATLYMEEGEYAEAELLYQRALQIREKAPMPEHRHVANVLYSLATLYVEEGRYAQAESLYQRALQIFEKALGPEHRDVATALTGLAAVYTHEDKYAQAEPILQRALQIDEKALGPEHPFVARALLGLAVLYAEEGKYEQADSLYQRALRIDEKALGPEHPEVAADLSNLAWLYVEEGKYVQADLPFQRALQIREKALVSEHPAVGTALFNLANLRFAQSQPEQAQPLYTRFFDNLFHQFERQFTFMSEKERVAFLATISILFPAYFSFVHQFHGKKPDLAGSMYDLLLREKGFIADSETALRSQVDASGDKEASKLLDQLGQKHTQIAALLNAQPPDRGLWRKQVEQLETEANDLEKALVARWATFAQQKKLERATWQQVRGALKPDEAAVEFARFDVYDGRKRTDTTSYVALVITPETKDYPAYVVLGDDKQLEGVPLVEFQQSVQDDGSEAAPETVQRVQPAAQAYDLYWKPLEPLLRGKTRLYLSLDGVLNQMPLGLMAAADGQLLMEKYDLRLLSSTKDLLREAMPSKNNMAVLVGNPSFGLSEAQQRAALQKLGTPQQSEPVQMAGLATTKRSRDQGTGSELEELPHTGAEVYAVSRLLEQHHWQAPIYIHDRALKEVVMRARSPRLLHLATHGFFLPNQQIKTDKLGSAKPSGLEDPMLRSGLYFAGANRALAGEQAPSDLDDGVLTAYEATGLNLQGTELVVLSACNTGRGEVKNGEGVFGLRRALQEAGAQVVMMSLWSVPDIETQELMTLFYSKWLGGTEKHEALRQAQLEMREIVKQRHDGRDLPYYWGAFVLVGR